MWHLIQHWLAYMTGSQNTSGAPPNYNFWSGFGSDLGEVAILGGLVTWARHANCEVHGCWRLGRHQTAAGHRVCRRHHPDDRLTAQAVQDAHQQASRQPE
jgi:hypothetical protein